MKIELQQISVPPKKTRTEIVQDPIWHEAAMGNLEAVKTQIEDGFPINAILDKNMQTVLSYAALNARIRVSRYLLDQPNIDISIRNQFGKTILTEIGTSIRGLEDDLRHPEKMQGLGFDVDARKKQLHKLHYIKKLLVKHIDTNIERYEAFGKSTSEIVENFRSPLSFVEREGLKKITQRSLHL